MERADRAGEVVRRPWVIVYDGSGRHGKAAYTLECRRCGDTRTPSLPISVTDFCRLAKSFGRDHAQCKVKNLEDPIHA